MSKKTVWVALTVAGVVPAALAGYWLGTPPPEPSEKTVSEPAVELPEVVFPHLMAGPRPPGQWAWSELRGGECIADYTSPWEDHFQVVACTGIHDAEFTRAVIIDSNPDALYPGDEWLEEFALAHCQSFEHDEFFTPELFDDLIVEPGYSMGNDAWIRGDRLAGCFVSQGDGESFSGPLLR